MKKVLNILLGLFMFLLMLISANTGKVLAKNDMKFQNSNGVRISASNYDDLLLLGFDDYEINNLSLEEFNELRSYHPRETEVVEEYIISYLGVNEGGTQKVKEVKTNKTEIYEKIKEHKIFKEEKAKKEKILYKCESEFFSVSSFNEFEDGGGGRELRILWTTGLTVYT